MLSKHHMAHSHPAVSASSFIFYLYQLAGTRKKIPLTCPVMGTDDVFRRNEKHFRKER
jgi:hypothetical protein